VVSIAGQSTEVAPVHWDNIQIASRDLEWTYDGVDYTWHVEVPDDVSQGCNLLQWDRQVNADTGKFYGGSSATQSEIGNTVTTEENALILADASTNNGNLTSWVDDATNAPWVADLATSLGATAKTAGYDSYQEAAFVQSAVGAIPYQLTSFPELPAQTLIDGGSRMDKSILLAGLLKNLGYQAALLYFSGTAGTEGHMAVGVVFSSNQVPNEGLNCYAYNGNNYYFAETSGSNLQLGASGTETPDYVYPVQ
jgi:hypothetical protein